MHKALWLMGGLGLGTGLMYMLDPDRGRRRRALARGQVEMYRRQTNIMLDQARRTLGEQTRTLSQQARGLLVQVRPSGHEAHTPRRDEVGLGAVWQERAQQLGGVQSLLILGCVGLGIGLMYLLDPNVGTRRRALVRDKARAYWRTTGTLIGKTARDVRNRTRGVVSEARTQLRGTAVADNTILEARVRAQLGHAMSHSSAISVTAHQGRVTLSGSISPSAADKLLATVASVAGVTEVVNHLEIHSEHISGWHNGNPVG